MIDTSKVNRVEVIDHTIPFEKGGGRAYIRQDKGIKVEVSLQDTDRTLKIFITDTALCITNPEEK
jgi:hypothetical protein